MVGFGCKTSTCWKDQPYVNWLGLVGLRLVEGEGWKKVGCEGLGRLVVGLKLGGKHTHS